MKRQNADTMPETASVQTANAGKTGTGNASTAIEPPSGTPERGTDESATSGGFPTAGANLSMTSLRYIVAVDTHRNFVRAAEACGVTQPTLSAGIRSLESALDVAVFDRGAHPVRPTALGERIIAQARKTLHNASLIEELVAVEKGDESGKATIGIIPTIAPYILPGLFRTIHSAHPSVHPEVSEMRTKFIIERLLAAELDMAILATPLGQKGLLEIPLYYEKFVAYIAPSDELYSMSEIPADRLASDRLWILEEGHCLRSQVFNFCHSRRNMSPEYQAGSIDNLIRIVDTNGGYTVIPELHTAFLSEEQHRNLRPIVRRDNGAPAADFPSTAQSSANGGATASQTPVHISASPGCPACVPVREVSLVIREDFVRERLLNVIAGCIKQIVPEEMLDSRLKRFAIRL